MGDLVISGGEDTDDDDMRRAPGPVEQQRNNWGSKTKEQLSRLTRLLKREGKRKAVPESRAVCSYARCSPCESVSSKPATLEHTRRRRARHMWASGRKRDSTIGKVQQEREESKPRWAHSTPALRGRADRTAWCPVELA